MVMKRPMVAFLTQLLLAIQSRFTRRARLEAENLILRQQLVVLQRKSPTRVRLWNIDRLLLVWLYRLYPSLLDAIIIVKPATVIRWHRRGFRAYWRWKSRHVGGRPRIDSEIRALIRRMSALEGQTRRAAQRRCQLAVAALNLRHQLVEALLAHDPLELGAIAVQRAHVVDRDIVDLPGAALALE
jgi:hypothetical protein